MGTSFSCSLKLRTQNATNCHPTNGEGEGQDSTNQGMFGICFYAIYLVYIYMIHKCHTLLYLLVNKLPIIRVDAHVHYLQFFFILATEHCRNRIFLHSKTKCH